MRSTKAVLPVLSAVWMFQCLILRPPTISAAPHFIEPPSSPTSTGTGGTRYSQQPDLPQISPPVDRQAS